MFLNNPLTVYKTNNFYDIPLEWYQAQFPHVSMLCDIISTRHIYLRMYSSTLQQWTENSPKYNYNQSLICWSIIFYCGYLQEYRWGLLMGAETTQLHPKVQNLILTWVAVQ